jgi:hypothetical protein
MVDPSFRTDGRDMKAALFMIGNGDEKALT